MLLVLRPHVFRRLLKINSETRMDENPFRDCEYVKVVTVKLLIRLAGLNISLRLNMRFLLEFESY